MIYVVTPRTERLVRDLLGLARELDGAALARASVLAQAEWNELLLRLPTEEDLRRGLVAMAEDELGWLLAKAIRFREILATDDGQLLRPLPRRSAHDSSPGL